MVQLAIRHGVRVQRTAATLLKGLDRDRMRNQDSADA
jgi:hypothetical protein